MRGKWFYQHFRPPKSAGLLLAIAALALAVAGMQRLVEAQLAGESVRLDTLVQDTTFQSPQDVDLVAQPERIPVGGRTSLLTATVTDLFLSPVPDGTEVLFETSLGSLGSPAVKLTAGGVATATLASGWTSGTAYITATAGGAQGYTTVEFFWYKILLPLIARNQ